MTSAKPILLSVGATGSIGTHVIRAAQKHGFHVRALVRSPKTAKLPPEIEIVEGDLTRPETLKAAVGGADYITFTHGTHGGQQNAEAVDYGGVRNILAALNGARPRVSLMTAIGTTDRKGAHDWKRRGERLIRASGLDYTIIRPGWFDYNEASQRRLVMPQGDVPVTGAPADGVIARDQLGDVLVRSLTSDAARNKTFALLAEEGEEQPDLDVVFAGLHPDVPGEPDGYGDPHNMPLDDEPADIRAAMKA
ncbi:SDR family oxidoreductase [Paracoccus aurantiacus]|uniref:SDR family oxidoreductase n=1 Tax=Paracoccus aurantiacus TaxID=2599412 RepID=A0A5C6RTH8_9RHOB|nr:SDR family oxidoreductase [Paracoccus aurantiacus]TXB65661.1 SDR family oxidoreductase [Paracoccus aurantiacus]